MMNSHHSGFFYYILNIDDGGTIRIVFEKGTEVYLNQEKIYKVRLITENKKFCSKSFYL